MSNTIDVSSLLRDSEKLESIKSIPMPPLPTWADAVWRSLYFFARTYPDQPTPSEQKNLVQFMTSMQGLLPCQQCRTHFAEHLSELENAKVSRITLYQWIFNVQNDINKRNGRKEYSWADSIEAVTRMSMGKGAHSIHKGSNGFPIWGIVLSVCIALALGIVTGMGITSSKLKNKQLNRNM